MKRVNRCSSRGQCRGKEHWEVREYLGLTGVGAREYRVVPGSLVQNGLRMNLPCGRIAHRHE